MYDSFGFSIDGQIPEKDLSDWKLYVEPKPDQRVVITYEKSFRFDAATIFFRYFPVSKFTGQSLISSYISSAQKMVNGNNIEPVTDTDEVIKKVNEVFRKVFPKMSFDVGQGKLWRCDFSTCYQVGDHVSYYLDVISRRHYPHRSRKTYDNRSKPKNRIEEAISNEPINGVSFYSKKVTSTFYDKELETKNPLAHGLLRHEVRVSGKKALTSKTGLQNPRLCDLTPEISLRILNRDLTALSLDKEIFCKENIHQGLVKKVGLEDSLSYFHMISDLALYPDIDRKSQANKLGVTYQTVGDWHRKIKQKGLAPDYAPPNITLPPLRASSDNQGSIEKHNKVLGDTKSFSKSPPDNVSSGKKSP